MLLKATGVQHVVPIAPADAMECVAEYSEPFVGRAIESGRDLHSAYLEVRDVAIDTKPEISDIRMAEIRTEVGRRFARSGIADNPDYAAIDQDTTTAKLDWLTAQLQEIAPEVSSAELLASNLFVQSAFALYNEVPTDGAKRPDADGTFAFVVPVRMDREHEDYGGEVEEVIPLLRYMPNELRADMLVGLPPCIIDRYQPDENGGRGYIIFAPIYNNERLDLEGRKGRLLWEFVKESVRNRELPTPKRLRMFGRGVINAATARANVQINHAVDFARSLGADVVGLGAVLPAISHFGQEIKNPDVMTTTGHGGTVHLIQETLRSVVEKKVGKAKDLQTIGILGCGSIGASIAHILGDEYKESSHAIVIYDAKKSLVERTKKDLLDLGISEDRIVIAANEAELLESGDVVVSAITTTLDLDKVLHADGRKPDIQDTVIIDDSQPGAFTEEQAKRHGVNLVWVVGEQHNGTEAMRRERFTYGGTMITARHIFGCEGEAGVLSAHLQDMLRDGVDPGIAQDVISRLAIRERVTPEMARNIGMLFKLYHIGPAQLQAYGHYIETKSAA